jgi:hypothetical protein
VCLVKKVVSSDAETGKQDAQKNMERDEKYFLEIEVKRANGRKRDSKLCMWVSNMVRNLNGEW